MGNYFGLLKKKKCKKYLQNKRNLFLYVSLGSKVIVVVGNEDVV